MLVLTHRLNQSIMIGEIEVTAIEVGGDQVRLGIYAPKDVPVHREEIYHHFQAETLQAETLQAETMGAAASDATSHADPYDARHRVAEWEESLCFWRA